MEEEKKSTSRANSNKGSRAGSRHGRAPEGNIRDKDAPSLIKHHEDEDIPQMNIEQAETMWEAFYSKLVDDGKYS